MLKIKHIRLMHNSVKLLRPTATAEHANPTNFEEDFYKNHIKITSFQRALLNAGCGIISIFDPTRADTIASLGETSGESALRYMHSKMIQSSEGSKILNERPRINSKTVDLDKLKRFPDGTLGKTYSNFLEKNRVTPDSRTAVQFIDDIDLAYVIQRYRECHDLIHTILGLPTNMLGEVTVKWVEAIQTKLPMCVGAAIFGPVRLKPKHRQLYLQYYLPWAIETGSKSEFLLNTYFEQRWEQSMTDLYKELNITPLVIQN